MGVVPSKNHRFFRQSKNLRFFEGWWTRLYRYKQSLYFRVNTNGHANIHLIEMLKRSFNIS